MQRILNMLTAFLVMLCKTFDVPPENMDDGRSGNRPPPEGGVSSTSAKG
jgi:hypothetical protein